MLELDLTAELDRQLSVCNACRYCEGFCAMFGAAQLRTAIGTNDVAYLANLCHDCRMCFDACMFTPPHEFAINIPAAMSAARVETYARYAKPAELAWLLATPRNAAIAAAGAGIVLVALAIALSAGVAALWTPQLGAGAFYRVLPYLAMVVPALAVSLFGFACVVLGASQYARDIGGGARFATAPALSTALREAVTLVYLKGGGAGCYDEGRGSGRRRFYHGLVFWGVLADFAATCSAAVLQDFLYQLPPYPLWSVPVVLGTGGGIALAIGAAGLLLVKRRSDARPAEPRMIALDNAFLGLLEVVALTGLALLAFRTTAAMGSLLAVHLGAVAGLFITAPYGKFVHFVYRIIALAKNAHEQTITSAVAPIVDRANARKAVP
jgi:citrate/tricarballylate utilization protein